MVVGSSPRMRGTQHRLECAMVWFRFIPAHAGNTRTNIVKTVGPSVHPRACGEHNAINCGNAIAIGSSPRMRGTLAALPAAEYTVRFIPAHAGNTQPRSSTGRPRTVHPRACGEHGAFGRRDPITAGSSPRMRGTHLSIPDAG